MCPVSESSQTMCVLQLASYFHFLQSLQAICTRWNLASILHAFSKLCNHFAVFEGFANFLKGSQFNEKLTEAAQATGLQSVHGLHATSRAPEVVRAPASAPTLPPGASRDSEPRQKAAPRNAPFPAPPKPSVLLCALAPEEAPRPAPLLPAAEVTVSPKSSHSPSSMNPDQAREHRAWRTHSCGPRRALGPHPPAVGFAEGLSLAGSPLPPGVGCSGHQLQSTLPIPAHGGRLWAQAFLAPAPPPRLPAPQRAGAARGAFEPGAPGVSQR